MIEVAVNHCFGGFGLSISAQLWLYAHKDPHQKIETRAKYFRAKETRKEQDDHLKFCHVATIGDDILLDNHDRENRSCPLLIQAIKSLGSDVNQPCSRIEIVQIPDGTKWVIDEYDGSESVEEAHRSW